MRPPGMAHGGYVLSPEEHYYYNWGEGYKRGGHVKKRKEGGFLGHEPPPGHTYKGYPHSPTTEEDDAVSPTKRGGKVPKGFLKHIKKHAKGGKVHSDEAEDRQLFHRMMKEGKTHEKGGEKRGGHVKRARGGVVGGGKFHSKGMAPHHWGTGMTAPGERLDSDGEGGKVERATIETPKVSAPGALVHMTAGSFSGLGRLQKSKLPQTGRTSKAEM